MESMSELVERIRGIDLERALGLRAEAPRVALELDRHEFSVVRMKPQRRGLPILEGHRIEQFDEAGVPSSIFDRNSLSAEQLRVKFRGLFEKAEVRPGRIGLVLPDNLAKITLLDIPERPSSAKQLEEFVRFKMNRAVPFRISEASLSYQVLPGDKKAITVLVALMRRPLVEKYEKALEAVGARPGLIDLCTPNLMNLCRDAIAKASTEGDVALLNCTAGYFSLLIVRQSRLIFYRCKSYAVGNAAEGEKNPEVDSARAHTLFDREIAGSISYYEEKLEGRGIGTIFVRNVASPLCDVELRLRDLGVGRIESMNPTASLELGEGVRMDPVAAQRLAPALGAAVGRG